MKTITATVSDVNPWTEPIDKVNDGLPKSKTKRAVSGAFKFVSQKRAIRAKDGDQVAGMLIYSTKQNMICCLAVEEGYRHKGLATALLCKGIQKLNQTLPIVVSTFREDDPKGAIPRALYKKFGFVPCELSVEYDRPVQIFRRYPCVAVKNIVGDNYLGSVALEREASRAVVVSGGKVLLTYESATDRYAIVGGGVEKGEAAWACCVREVAEETGYVVEPSACYLIVNELYGKIKFTSYYFECSVVGQTEVALTEAEAARGLRAEWVDIQTALDVFSHYDDYAESDVIRNGTYLREYVALTQYLEYKKSLEL